jgi:hypothetical protein
VITGEGALTVSVSVAVLDSPAELVAVSVTGKVPVLVGVPEIVLTPSKLRPAGRAVVLKVAPVWFEVMA